MYDITNLFYFSCYICAKNGYYIFLVIRMQVLLADTGEVKTLTLALEGLYCIYLSHVLFLLYLPSSSINYNYILNCTHTLPYDYC